MRADGPRTSTGCGRTRGRASRCRSVRTTGPRSRSKVRRRQNWSTRSASHACSILRTITSARRRSRDALLEKGVVPCGLGARDSLRLEVAYRLYGNDMDEDHTPLEAGLGWIVKLDKQGGFIGSDALVRQKQEGLKRSE